jgi:Ni,Fe-hydrogenase III small subunit
MKLLLRKILKTPVVTERGIPQTDAEIETLGKAINEEVRRLFGRSLHIREVDPGSCNGCELEIGGLNSPYYDLERFGLHFVASPRHADCLLVTGPVTRNMADPLKRTYDATPDPKIVVAVGDCAKDCGIFAGGYGVVGPVSAIIPVDVIVPGCPPNPRAILAGILKALESR